MLWMLYSPHREHTDLIWSRLSLYFVSWMQQIHESQKSPMFHVYHDLLKSVSTTFCLYQNFNYSTSTSVKNMLCFNFILNFCHFHSSFMHKIANLHKNRIIEMHLQTDRQTEGAQKSKPTDWNFSSSFQSLSNQDSLYIIPVPPAVRAGRGPLPRRSTPYELSCLVLSCQREGRKWRRQG